MHKKYIITSTITLIITIFIINNDVFALTYSDNINMQFTFNPTISIDITGDLNIDELVPGGYSDSNIITVTASSNNLSGYTLYSNVGNDSTYNYTELKNGTNTFTNLTANKSSLDSFDDNANTWGYSYSVDNGTTWISGDYNNYNTGYNGLPLYNNGSGIKLADTNTNTTSTINFKIGARATSNQVSGTYANIINFYAISKQSPTTFEDAYKAHSKTKYNGYYTMQDMSTDICKNSNVVIGSTIELIDTRDNEVYRIAKLKDENCWLLDNLRLDPTDPAVAANMSSANTNATDAAIANYLGTTFTANSGWSNVAVKNATSEFMTYVRPLINTAYKDNDAANYGIGNGRVGVYYNYCAASVGTYCYTSSTGVNLPDTLIDAPYDVCSAGWRIPTGSSIGEYQDLFYNYNTTQTASNPASLQYNLSASLSGYFYYSSQTNFNGSGIFWSSTYNSNNGIYTLGVNFNDINPTYNTNRDYGFSIRCLAQ